MTRTSFTSARSRVRSQSLSILLSVTSVGAASCADVAPFETEAAHAPADNEAAEVSLQHDAIRTVPSRALQTALDEIVRAGVPGAIAYARHGERESMATSGVRDLETGTPLEVRDRFRAGSITKSFTATVILQLVAERRVELDDSVEHWLPGRVPNGANISVRNLLNHTSGLFNFVHDPRVSNPYFVDGDFSYYHTSDDLLRYALEHPPLFVPGSAWEYSNTNYLLLGMVIEAVTGRSPVAEIHARLIAPLGLRRSSLPVRDPAVHGPHMHGYIVPSLGEPANGEPVAEPTDITFMSPSWARTAGGIVSTVDDIAHFYRALFSGALLPPAQLAAQRETVAMAEADGDARYGLGVITWPTPCGTAWGHDGDSPGYKTIALYSEDGSRQAVVAISSDDWTDAWPSVPELKRAVLAAFCGS
jgi:D-alanyl-D-alanine carboxypeptidase